MPSSRLNRKLVAVAASAITAVYIAGYVRTQAADSLLSGSSDAIPITATVGLLPESAEALAPTAPPPGSSRVTSTPVAPPRLTLVPTAVGRSAAVVPTHTPSPSTGLTAPSAGLKDGTYSGVGTSRRGDVQVSLAVQSGRVISVNIIRATTQYPTRLIAGLPGQVVSRQSAQIDSVSGATFSSLAFRAAVQQALQQAHG